MSLPRSAGIDIVGADANNLAGVDVTFARRAWTAVVGVSGSGKSSLVEGTLATEAADRMRRFLDVDLGSLGTDDVRAFVGELPPTLFVGQQAFRPSSRTTIATSTGLLRVLRRLFLRAARPFAADVGAEVPEPSPTVFAQWLSRHVSGTAIVWAVPLRNTASDGVAAVQRLLNAGLKDAVVRSETDRGAYQETGRAITLARFRPLRADVRHTIEARVGEVRLGKATLATLLELLEQAWRASNGAVLVELPTTTIAELKGPFGYRLDATSHRVHPDSARVYAPPSTHMLSFNAPEHFASGACPVCRGLGRATEVDEAALVVHPERTLHEGALALWTTKNYRYVNIQHETIEGLRERNGFDPDRPWRELSASARALILDGSPDPVVDRDRRTGKKASAPRTFTGFRQAILERVTAGGRHAAPLAALVRQGPCRMCEGTRWSAQARALKVCGWSIDGLLALPFATLAEETKGGRLGTEAPPNAQHLVANLQRLAVGNVSVGLGHLSGDRGMLDVSDGEARRTRLAGVLNSRLAGLLLVLDEPARGLHELDLVSLGDALRRTTERHTVVISEHRQRLVARADELLELGPGAGTAGGQIVYHGPVEQSAWGRGTALVTLPSAPPVKRRRWLRFEGASIHNVTNASVDIPLGALSCIAGVSGSGKSSFVRGVLVPALAKALPAERVHADDFRTRLGTWRAIRGLDAVTSLHAVDQSPAAAHRRSLVATFLGIAEAVRDTFASTSEAKRLGLLARDFSTNSGDGRCQRCLGLGMLTDGEQCPVCGGLRFGFDVLSVRVGELNLVELFDAPMASLAAQSLPKTVVDPGLLHQMEELGIGYLSLGRSLDTLSGGEVQRLRIVRALARPDVSGALFVLDEPAGGLHPRDIERLHRALRHMVADGANTVVLVEHDPLLLAACDLIVEFGPGGGPAGGKVLASDHPDAVREMDTPTGHALRATVELPPTPVREPTTPVRAAATRADALRARAEIRQILGDDVEVPDEGSADEATVPTALVTVATDRRRPRELGGLDNEIAKFLLDAVGHDVNAGLRNLAAEWSQHANAHLRIHPMLDAMVTWGAGVPSSIAAEARKHLATMGLRLMAEQESDVRALRATGPRFQPTNSSPESRLVAVRDAFMLGGGYVELVDARGRELARFNARLMDLERGLVGPRRPTPGHLRRDTPLGRCPMCRGQGVVAEPDAKLLVGNQRAKVLDASFLDPRAAAILKGVVRAEFTPFFRRLADEGLWNDDARWSDLTADQRTTVFHGYWIRPGHGTFLKKGSDIDGSEVNHWLRWGGLCAAVESQLARSSDAAWCSSITASRRNLPCPTCRGAGLGSTADLVFVGARSLREWEGQDSLAGFLDALRQVPAERKRSNLTRQRVLECLKPLSAADPLLRSDVDEAVARRIEERIVRVFTGMSVITG